MDNNLRTIPYGRAACRARGRVSCRDFLGRRLRLYSQSRGDAHDHHAPALTLHAASPLHWRTGISEAKRRQMLWGRSGCGAHIAACALFCVAAVSPRDAAARIHNCEHASLLPEDGERLFLVARRVLPAHRELMLAERCRWSDSAFAWVTTARVTGENGVAQWWMASCSRDAHNWTCSPGVLHQEIEKSLDAGGVSRHVRISFDGATSPELADSLAAQALVSYVKPTAPLPYCSGMPGQESRWSDLRESRPLPTPSEEIHITIDREKERMSVWFGDLVRPDDIQIGIDFPVPDVQQSGPCWVAREP